MPTDSLDRAFERAAAGVLGGVYTGAGNTSTARFERSAFASREGFKKDKLSGWGDPVRQPAGEAAAGRRIGWREMRDGGWCTLVLAEVRVPRLCLGHLLRHHLLS